MKRLVRYINDFTKTGTQFGDSTSVKRSIILSNCIALILILVSALLFIIVPQNRNWGGFSESLFGMVVFTIPILLNLMRLNLLGRLFLCWAPPILIFWIMILGMIEAPRVSTSAYNGLRIYLLATSCIPYLLLDRKPVFPFVLALMPSLLGLLFLEFWLNLFGVGYSLKGIPDDGYWFAPVRGLLAYIVVSGSCLTLKYIVDRMDQKNQKLIAELERINKIIKKQAESELNSLNQKLLETIKEISKREFILEQSQEIAKVGSWEFNRKDKTLFWSHEMYDIFGIDKSFDINQPQLTQLLFGDSAFLIDVAHKEVIDQSKPYDFTLTTKTPIGYIKWVRVAGFPLVLDDKVVGITGIVHDVTVFKEAEERIRASEKNYRSLFEQASDAIMITDFRGNFSDVNSSMHRMLGYTKDEFVRMNIQDIIEPKQLKTNPINFDRLAIGEQIIRERTLLRKDGSTVQVEVNVKMFSEGKLMAIARDITGRKQTEREKEKIRYDLNERVKELTTLYKVSQILQIDSRPPHETLQDIVNIIPAGWQYPQITAARIYLAGMEFTTSNFGLHKHRQSAEFNTLNGLFGTIEIVYLEHRQQENEGPFLTEERDLINMLANMIQTYLNRRYEADALKRSEANLSATINNTNFLIWSVNREYELISFNNQFSKFFETRFGATIKLGTRFIDGSSALLEIRERWLTRYNRALSGEAFKVIAEVGDRQMEFSLNPIIEDNRIIGVTVFGEDITDRLKQEKKIQEANKLIGELQLMALRSVMNPHFIFNSLNAIQYYILENDARSAVTYLSTFSKLIRAILSNSVKSKVRLSEELDMIKNYIQMESMRFENKFDSFIQVNDDIDVENLEIPSMLIQPYVENAILHGLYNKKDRGRLKICIQQQNGSLLFEIEDDGIGRKAAELLKQQSPSQHKSMGTALTEERLKLINRDGQATVTINDLELEGKAVGTRVCIWVKYEGFN